MNNLFTLISMMMKNTTFATNSKSRKTRSKFSGGNPVFYSIFSLIIFTVLMIIMNVAYVTLEDKATADEILTSNLLLNLVSISFIFSSSYIFSAYFLNTDDSYYLQLPLSGQTIFTARFLAGFILGCTIPLACPISFYICRLIGGLSFNFMTFLNPLIFYIGIQLICSSFVFAVGIVLSEVFHLRKHRQAMIVINFLFIFLGAALFGFGTSFTSGTTFIPRTFSAIINSLNGSGDLLVSLYCLLIGLASFIIIYFLARFFYIKSLMGSNEKKKKAEKLDLQTQNLIFQKSFAKGMANSNVFLAYLKDEFQTIFRSGTYVFSFVLTTVLMSLCITIIIPISFMSLKTEPGFTPLLALLLFNLFLQFMSLFNFEPGVAYTKDRQSFVGICVLPVGQKKLFWAKIIPLSSIVMLMIIVFSFTYGFLFTVDLALAIIYFISTVFSLLGTNYLSQIFDLKFGNANAPNELSVTRNNKSTIISVGLSFGIHIILGMLPFISLLAPLDPIIVALICLVCSMALFIVPFALTYNKIPLYAQQFIQRSNN